VVNATGSLAERYEYSAYGQRQVFTSAGSNDPGCYTPILASRKITISSLSQPWGLNEVGHQGLLHDEQANVIYSIEYNIEEEHEATYSKAGIPWNP
jgi:hypothetical protein